MKKLVGIAALGILAVALWWVSSLDARVARAIEESASASLGTRVTVEGVDLSPRERRGTIRGLRVANPEGFSDADLFVLEEIDLVLEPETVGGQPVRLRSAEVGEARVRFEITESGDSNLAHVLHHLSEHGGEAPDDGDGDGDEPPRVAIDALRFDGGRIEVWDADDPTPERVDLPSLELAEVGGEDGATGGALAREIARALSLRVAAATAVHELSRAVEKELGETAGEVAESILRSILD